MYVWGCIKGCISINSRSIFIAIFYSALDLAKCIGEED